MRWLCRPAGSEDWAAMINRLLEECRRQKEAFHPNARKIVVDRDHAREGWGQVTIPTEAFHERCRPLVEETIRRVAELVGDDPIEALYVTGGAASCPWWAGSSARRSVAASDAVPTPARRLPSASAS